MHYIIVKYVNQFKYYWNEKTGWNGIFENASWFSKFHDAHAMALLKRLNDIVIEKYLPPIK